MKRLIIVSLVGFFIGFVLSYAFGPLSIIISVPLSGLWGWNANKIFDWLEV